MTVSTFLEKFPRAQIKDLERFIAAGDIAGMASTIESLHTKWDTLSESMQEDIERLEAIFLSLAEVANGSRLTSAEITT